MKIKNLALYNFRCFEKYELTLSDRFTVLIGDNGSGKTAVLEGLAVAAGGFLSRIPDLTSNEKRNISQDDIRKISMIMGQTPVKETADYTTFVKATGIINGHEGKWIRFKNPNTFHEYKISQINFDNQIKDSIDNLIKKKSEADTTLPVIAYYGTGRLWINIAYLEIETLSPDSRLIGYQDCLNPASNLEQLFRWFKTQELAALQKKERRYVLEAVRAAIINMIPDSQRVWWDIDWDEILIETKIQEKTQTIPFHLLSDGYRNMIGMVADIAYRMATLNPQLEEAVIKQTEGIVLIDEIDLHLHPKWQRQVVERLLNTFPKVQFVATSHSPFIIQSLYRRKDALVWDLEKAQPLAIESESIEDIAEDQQHVEIPQKSKRFLDMMEAAEAYYRKLHEVNNASDAEVISLRAQLDELTIPFSDDPAFAAQLKFERETLLGSKSE